MKKYGYVINITMPKDRKDYFRSKRLAEEVKEMSKKNNHADVDLRGTLISVFFVGVVIVAMWVIVYSMYVAR